MNQVILNGSVEEIYTHSFDLKISEGQVVTIEVDNTSNLLLDNKVAIKGHIYIEVTEVRIICDELIILDGRGKSDRK